MPENRPNPPCVICYLNPPTTTLRLRNDFTSRSGGAVWLFHRDLVVPVCEACKRKDGAVRVLFLIVIAVLWLGWFAISNMLGQQHRASLVVIFSALGVSCAFGIGLWIRKLWIVSRLNRVYGRSKQSKQHAVAPKQQRHNPWSRIGAPRSDLTMLKLTTGDKKKQSNSPVRLSASKGDRLNREQSNQVAQGSFRTCAEAVDILISLYDSTPRAEGFLTSDSGKKANLVRQIGEKLNEMGAMDEMLEAHARFKMFRPRAARNLEMMWDGIGPWRG